VKFEDAWILNKTGCQRPEITRPYVRLSPEVEAAEKVPDNLGQLWPIEFHSQL